MTKYWLALIYTFCFLLSFVPTATDLRVAFALFSAIAYATMVTAEKPKN